MPSAPKAAQGGSSQAAPAPGSSGRSVWQFAPRKIEEGTYSAMISETLLFRLEAGADLGVLRHQPPREEDPALAVHHCVCLWDAHLPHACFILTSFWGGFSQGGAGRSPETSTCEWKLQGMIVCFLTSPEITG